MLNSDYAYRSALDLSATFGAGFAGRLDGLTEDSWQGPVQSGFGFHVILLSAIYPSQPSPFDAMQQQVVQDYRRSQQVNARDAYIENLIDEYKITVQPR